MVAVNRRTMRGLFVLALSVAALLLAPVTAEAAEYKTYGGCGISSGTSPSHVCQVGEPVGAFFESSEETEYEVCVRFPSTETLCAEEQLAQAGTLYVNKILTNQPGAHLITWYVEGVEIGSWTLTMEPPPPPLAYPSAPTPPEVAPAPSARCVKARHRLRALRAKLSAAPPKRRAHLRSEVKRTRAAVNRLC
ncbi:MAG: hypothetical protein ACTHK6_06000 [Solirubrobacterales bacterium]